MSAPIPTVFLPGLLSDQTLWQHQITALGAEIQPFVADLTQHSDLPSLAQFVLKQAPERFALVGLSMGGYVAFEILRQAPERVLRLCLFDTSARADTPQQQERRRLLLAMARSGQFKGVTPRLLPMLIHPDRFQDKALTETIMAMAERVGRVAFQRQQTAILNRVDSRPDLLNIRCPTLVIGGREDTLTPPDITREIAVGISGADYVLIESCGHLPPLERPEEATRLFKRWLAM